MTKKFILMLAMVLLVLTGCNSIQRKEDAKKNIKPIETVVKLEKGEVKSYDFGTVKVHAYNTNDFLEDYSYVMEKNGKAVLLESPSFYDNYEELSDYISSLGVEIEGVIISYHAAGAGFLETPELSDIPVYSTDNIINSASNGAGAAMLNKFKTNFGSAFDEKVYAKTMDIKEGMNEIAGIEMNITNTGEGFDIEIPEINSAYIHMLGHDSHSIVAGNAGADAMLAKLKGLRDKDYTMFFTTHYSPETSEDVTTKIEYLENMKRIAAEAKNSSEFIDRMNAAYPNYSGGHYLNITSGIFFQN